MYTPSGLTHKEKWCVHTPSGLTHTRDYWILIQWFLPILIKRKSESGVIFVQFKEKAAVISQNNKKREENTKKDKIDHTRQWQLPQSRQRKSSPRVPPESRFFAWLSHITTSHLRIRVLVADVRHIPFRVVDLAAVSNVQHLETVVQSPVHPERIKTMRYFKNSWQMGGRLQKMFREKDSHHFCFSLFVVPHIYYHYTIYSTKIVYIIVYSIILLRPGGVCTRHRFQQFRPAGVYTHHPLEGVYFTPRSEKFVLSYSITSVTTKTTTSSTFFVETSSECQLTIFLAAWSVHFALSTNTEATVTPRFEKT